MQLLIRIILATLFLAITGKQSNGQSILLRPDFNQYFTTCGTDGAIAIFDYKKQQWILSDTVATRQETLPASTFKIINMLIALETKTIADEQQIVPWPGSTDTLKYGYRPEIYHDITVKEAFEVSAGWAFIELAKKIDRNVYQQYLTQCGYGNTDVTEQGVDFWNFGALGISPVSQVAFIKNLYEGKLPFSQRNMDIVKKVMISEQLPAYTIHSKTGWTMAGNTNTGWWVGYLERKHNVYFFATRLLQHRSNNRSDFSRCRKEVTRSILRALGILPYQ